MTSNGTESRLPTLMDIASGICLLSIGTVGLSLYTLITIALIKLSNEMKGFRILVSDAFSNFGQIVMFGIWPGIITMFQYDPLPEWSRFPIAILNNGFWFAMSMHYAVIAFTRLIAVARPIWFRTTFIQKLYRIIAVIWGVAFAQSVYLTTRPWWVIFYYTPSHYGLSTHEISKFVFDGQMAFWAVYNRLVTITPFLLYFAAMAAVFKQRNQVHAAQTNESKFETRLLIPCVVNQAFYFGGCSILFDILVVADKGLWGQLLINVFFTVNSSVNAILLFTMSEPVREKVVQLVRNASGLPVNAVAANG